MHAIETIDSIMSQGCNFINSLMSASRRRASSATPSVQNNDSNYNNSINTTTTTDSNTGRRASSSGDLAKAQLSPTVLTDKSTYEKHVNTSSETVCDSESTQTNLISSDDISQMDMESLRLQEECDELEAQAEYWEQRVEELERRRFAEDVPRSLVENIIQLKKELRELEFQHYQLKLESEESDKQSLSCASSCKIGSINESGLVKMGTDIIDFDESERQCIGTGRFGSRISPGQENTADILVAIPPSGSLQHRHHSRHMRRRREQQQVYVQLETVDQKMTTRSPIRPNHFKSDFRTTQVIISQDSSSTASSSSPH